ncbi:ribosomal RNA processing protein 36 homolog [Thalassophryne amazonica]|uniref:ribosomal RNA processing protein 36 homolog n=1 Tax=Thalassophryne amazonica TaxID=390379 RepID=UPI001470F3A7|nr:ribosomal RNA processing protein 36 homolog [Thalassophryne amazonica]
MKQQHQRPAAMEMMESSSGDEDSDVEKNYTLISERGEAVEEESGEEEESGQDEHGDVEDTEGGGSASRDVRKELSSMSFEDIMKLQNKVGTKAYNAIAYGNKTRRREQATKRLNKNRPVEISSKKPVPFLCQVVPVKKTTMRDPRFDDLSGEYKPAIFETSYKFINDLRQREKEVVKKELKKMKKNSQRKEKLQSLLKRMENQERVRKSRKEESERELQFKKQQREGAKQGLRPFFIKKSEKKKLQLAEKYQQLKKSGKLDTFLSKKRKRNTRKDRRKLPG